VSIFKVKAEQEDSRSEILNLQILFFIYLRGWSETQSTTAAAIYRPIVPALDDTDEDYGATGGLNARGNLPQYRSVHHRLHIT
jgi:hypothetical protein